ncbi:MAG: hypothetical protein ACLVJ6_11915 [Merdibacter sp.]
MPSARQAKTFGRRRAHPVDQLGKRAYAILDQPGIQQRECRLQRDDAKRRLRSAAAFAMRRMVVGDQGKRTALEALDQCLTVTFLPSADYLPVGTDDIPVVEQQVMPSPPR